MHGGRHILNYRRECFLLAWTNDVAEAGSVHSALPEERDDFRQILGGQGGRFGDFLIERHWSTRSRAGYETELNYARREEVGRQRLTSGNMARRQ